MKRKLLIIRVLALIALALSVYILWTSSSQKAELAGCGEGSGCEAVLQTKWSSWFGLPVSAGAIVVYGSILLLTFLVTTESKKGWLLLAFFSLLASASGVWFMLLQAFLIKSYCIYCSIVHFCGILITVFVLKTIPVREEQTGKK
ncbi:MAG: vitamin K epoxide reductase family protein, partial [Acidobacteriota bacterium]